MLFSRANANVEDAVLQNRVLSLYQDLENFIGCTVSDPLKMPHTPPTLASRPGRVSPILDVLAHQKVVSLLRRIQNW
jgi:hypothetical protein